MSTESLNVVKRNHACDINALAASLAGSTVNTGEELDDRIKGISDAYGIDETLVTKDLCQKMKDCYPDALQDPTYAASVQLLSLAEE